MIVVTGGAGFIGSNLVRRLNEVHPSQSILVVDDLTEGAKFRNLVDCAVADYLDKHDFLQKIQQNETFPGLDAVFHQGACSLTTEWDGQYMMKNNYEYSKRLLSYCLLHKIPFIYASSASVYGLSGIFKEEPSYERPINVYAYSKYLFDQYVRCMLTKAQSPVVGLRYFNVYGPKEHHKGKMASVVLHAYQQLRTLGEVHLFKGIDGYKDGEQLRDFIHVDDVVAVNLWFFKSQKSGIYNVGTGRSESFNTLAKAVIHFYGKGEISYISFPDHLRDCYQNMTQADILALREIGYEGSFRSLEQGVKDYLSLNP